MDDLTNLTDAELGARLDAYLAERDRREALASIPAQVAGLVAEYRAGGGDPDTLRAAIDTPGQ